MTPLHHLVDAVWDDTPPNTAGKQVRNSVSDLRKLLSRVDAELVAETVGYRLEIAEVELDATIFDQHLEQARDQVESKRYIEAAATLHRALALWRGPALAGLNSSALEPQIVGLNEQRLTALEQFNYIRLELGRHHMLVGELAEWVAAYPLRERLASQLMLALYRSGRQADALAVYDNIRIALAEKLGIDPGIECQELRQRILTNDRVLATPDVPEPSGVTQPSPRFARPSFHRWSPGSSDGPKNCASSASI